MTQPEDFDKDIELAKIQVDATIWASYLSIYVTVGFALLGGAVLGIAAYRLSNPNWTTNIPYSNFVGLVTLTVLAVIGIVLAAKTLRKDEEKRKEWEDKFKEIYKKVKKQTTRETKSKP